ncbi:unnamed protein product [Cylicostephanus goldi]|uniref:FERM domain-containing protein n=1 Tax=Cylicostephanus goldi TaxID=71465 RepID=A0A3P6RRJ2_CYLGO|nr:unnamed protein product [Cylicostephanus goldi]
MPCHATAYTCVAYTRPSSMLLISRLRGKISRFLRSQSDCTPVSTIFSMMSECFASGYGLGNNATSWTGRHLFDAVCRIIGLREVWFFGLQFTNKKGLPCWLQMDKEVLVAAYGLVIRKQDVPRGEDGCMQFLFLVKFYPEDVEDELIQDLTRHLFFLQIKQAILSMDLYCSPEASVLLASFAVQAINGDCTDETEPLDLDKLLPKSVIEQYDMSADMWRERIKRWWQNNHGQTRSVMLCKQLQISISA